MPWQDMKRSKDGYCTVPISGQIPETSFRADEYPVSLATEGLEHPPWSCTLLSLQTHDKHAHRDSGGAHDGRMGSGHDVRDDQR